jgi:hypothetical protein
VGDALMGLEQFAEAMNAYKQVSTLCHNSSIAVSVAQLVDILQWVSAQATSHGMLWRRGRVLTTLLHHAVA